MNVDIKNVAEALQTCGREVSVISYGGEKKFHFTMRKEDMGYLCVLPGKQRLSLNDLKLFGDTLLALHKELESYVKFEVGDKYFTVSPLGDISEEVFLGANFEMNKLIANNVFKTQEEAKEAKEGLMSEFRKAREQYVVGGCA